MHLVHPALVHFAVAFLFAGSAVEAAGLLAGRTGPARFGAVLTLVGTLTLIPVLVSGYVAANSLALPDTARRALDLHELNGWLVLGVFVGLLFWKGWYRGAVPESQATLYAAALVAGAILVAYSALLGGELVYVYGVGVAVGE